MKQLASIFDSGRDEEFNEFVSLSEHLKLLENNYLGLAEMDNNPSNLVWLIATTVHRAGSLSMEYYNKTENIACLRTAISCYNMCTILNENFLTGYFSLCTALCMDDQMENAKEVLDQGERRYLELKGNINNLSIYEKAMVSEIDPQFIQALRDSVYMFE